MMSVADRLNAGLQNQASISKKEKKRKKRKRESEDNTSIIEADVHPMAFSSTRPPGFMTIVDRLEAGRKRELKERTKAKRHKKRKMEREDKAKALVATVDHVSEQIGHENVAPSNTPKANKNSTRPMEPSKKFKANLLMQTILKGCRNITVPPTALSKNPSVGNAAVVSTTGVSKPNLTLNPDRVDLITVREVKSKTSPQSRARTKKKDAQVSGMTRSPSMEESITGMKTSSTPKIQATFSQAPIVIEEEDDFFDDDEPLMRKQERMRAIYSPMRPSSSELSPKNTLALKAFGNATTLKDWEMDSGKVRGIVRVNSDEEPEENLAFSSSFIAKRTGGVHIRDVSFDVVTVENGKKYNFDAEKVVGLRICSVASGTAEVKLGKMEFEISVGGMWRIKSGEGCVVKNKEENATVLHVTSMA